MSDGYIPALRFHRLTPLYDPLARLGMRSAGFSRDLIARMALRPGMRVLDLGCGTGMLAMDVKRSHPDVVVFGLDIDPAVLIRATDRATRAGVAINWDLGPAYQLPYADTSFDRVVSRLVIHHLTPADKQRTFREVYRVLRPGGELHVLDFGSPYSRYTRLAAVVMRRLEQTADHFDGRLPNMLRQGGFTDLSEMSRFTFLLGPLVSLRATRPAASTELTHKINEEYSHGP
jgi:ubiquinone/menaquinone biosynthesis C-methylase UbiE